MRFILVYFWLCWYIISVVRAVRGRGLRQLAYSSMAMTAVLLWFIARVVDGAN